MICASVPIVVSCITIGVITSLKNYPAGFPDAVETNATVECVPLLYLLYLSGCAGDAVVSSLYCHVEVLGSVPGEGEIYMENSISAAHPAHSTVISRPRLYLVEGKAASDWPSAS